jgi:hypothetical protein
MKLSRYKKVRISGCDKSCIAKAVIDKTTQKVFKKVFIGPGGVNPTSPLCRVVGGKPSVFFYENKNAVSVCIFKDKSFLLGWDLMNRLEKL